MSVTGKYRVAVVKSKGADFEIEERDIPHPGAGQVLVKVVACGICHSDIYTKQGVYGTVFPRAPGHEAAGTVAALGEGVTTFKVGDRVGAGWHGGHCNSCDSCNRAEFVLCKNGKITGITHDGGYGEYMVVPVNSLARIPEGIPFEEAGPLLCAGITVFNSLRNVGARAGDVVAVQGLGGLGHLAVQFANKMGFKVVALSTSPDKKQLAEELGAHIYVDSSSQNPVQELAKLGGARVIICTAPHAKSISDIIPALSTNGVLLLVGAPSENLSFYPGILIMKKARIQGWPSGSAVDSEDTLAFAQLTGVRPKIEKFKLDDINKAYDIQMNNKARFRAVIVHDHKL